MILIGKALGKMHQADIIHSDLTTSNMMLRLENKRAVLVERPYRDLKPWANTSHRS